MESTNPDKKSGVSDSPANSTSYYSAKYAEACEKMVDKAVDEIEYKSFLKCFDTNTFPKFEKFEEQVLQSFCRQFADYYRKGIKEEIEKMNKKHNIDGAMKNIFEQKQRLAILNAVNSAELKRDIDGSFTMIELEKNMYDTFKLNLDKMKDANLKQLSMYKERSLHS